MVDAQPKDRPVRASRTRIAATAPLTLLVCLLVFGAQSFAATAENVPTRGEAWYEVPVTGGGEDDPTCALPTGCAPVATPVVAGENTLQVAVTGGRDRARTFLAFDVSTLPAGAMATGGTVTMPVLTSQDSGSLNPETAKLSACPVAGTVKDAQGGPPEEQPQYSCATAAEGKFNADADPPTFTFELGPVASSLTFGGIAIVPSEAAHEGGDTFQVAFPTRKHESKAKITASVTYGEPPKIEPFAPPPPPPPAPPPGPGLESFDSGIEDFGGGSDQVGLPSVADPLPADVAPVEEQPLVAGPAEPVAEPLAAPAPFGYAYPAVWLAPLALLGVAGALARALSGEIVVPEAGGGATTAAGLTTNQPGLLERLIAAVRPPAAPQSPTAG